MTKQLGPTFADETIAAGLGGLPFSWGATDDSITGRIKQKLVETKQKWASEGRLLTGRTAEREAQRLPPGQREVKNWPTLAEYLAGQEKQYIDHVLHASREDKSAAAKVLGVDEGKLG